MFFAMGTYNRFKRADGVLRYLAVCSSYIFFAYGFAILGTAPTFGKTPACNADAVIVVFQPLSALHAGRVLCLVVLCIAVFIHFSSVFSDCRERIMRSRKARMDDTDPARTEKGDMTPSSPRLSRMGSPDPDASFSGTAAHGDVQSENHAAFRKGNPFERVSGYDTGLDGRLLLRLSFIAVIWALAVMNTELLIRWNHFQPTNASQWQFDQVRSFPSCV